MNCNCTDWNVDVIYYLRASKVMCKLTDQWLNFSMEIMHFQAYGSPRQYSHFMWVLKLLTSHKYHCNHPVQIQGSNHTHFLTSFGYTVAQSRLLANGHIYRPRKELHCQKWRPYMSRKLFSKTIRAKRRRETAHPVPTMGFLPLAHAIWDQCVTKVT